MKRLREGGSEWVIAWVRAWVSACVRRGGSDSWKENPSTKRVKYNAKTIVRKRGLVVKFACLTYSYIRDTLKYLPLHKRVTWARGRTAIKSEVCYTGHVLSERVQQARHIKHRLWTVNCTPWTCLMSTIEVVDNIPFFKRHYFNENCWANQSFTVILFIGKRKFQMWVPWMYFQK